MPDQQLKISICIPVYNGEKTLEETLESVFFQKIDGAEVILVDNASTDKTLLIAGEFVNYGLTIYRNRYNLGFNGNANRCLSLANSKYLMILSADDKLYPDAAKSLLSAIDEDPSIAFGFGASDIIDENANRIGFQSASFEGGIVKGETFLNEILTKRHAVALSTTIIHRERLKSIGGFNEHFINSDFMFQAILASKWDVYYYPKATGAIRIMPNSTGEMELYGKTDLLSKKLKMLDSLFLSLPSQYQYLKKKSRNRWVRFSQKMVVLTRLRYGWKHAALLSKDILKNEPINNINVTGMAIIATSLISPRPIIVLMIKLAALLGFRSPAFYRAIKKHTE